MGKLNILSTSFDKLFVVQPNSFQDERGVFSRLYCQDELEDACKISIKQINHSLTYKKGTVRGLHFQYEPHAEVKIVKCIQGSIYDVVVDIRKDSPTFLKTFSIELTKENQKMLCIPKGFAHGFQTLEDNTELLYFHSNIYVPENEGALNVKEPRLNIEWPLEITSISNKDQFNDFLNNSFRGVDIYEM